MKFLSKIFGRAARAPQIQTLGLHVYEAPKPPAALEVKRMSPAEVHANWIEACHRSIADPAVSAEGKILFFNRLTSGDPSNFDSRRILDRDMREGLINENPGVRCAAQETFKALVKHCSNPDARLKHDDLFQWLAEILDKKNDTIIPQAQIEALKLFEPLTKNPSLMRIRKVEALLIETMVDDRPEGLQAQGEYFRGIARNNWLVFWASENKLDKALLAIARHSKETDATSLQFNRTIILRAAQFGFITGKDIMRYVCAVNGGLSVEELKNAALLIQTAYKKGYIDDAQCMEIVDLASMHPHYKIRDMGRILTNMIPEARPQKLELIPEPNLEQAPPAKKRGPIWIRVGIDKASALTLFNRHSNGAPTNHTENFKVLPGFLAQQPVEWANAAFA